MRIIAFINDGPVIREILGHLGEPTSAPRIAPARGPPLWEMATAGEQAENAQQWVQAAHFAPKIEFDQRIAC